jgi:hypothetical protein
MLDLASGEAEARWWNLALPIKKIGMVSAVLMLAGFTYAYLEPLLRACLWAAEHHSTATYQGLSVKVPWLWRQDDVPAGLGLHLVRARLGKPFSLESIVIGTGKVTTSSPETIEEGFRTLSQRLGQSFHGTPVTLDPYFSCIAPHIDGLQSWQIACLSTDHHWRADLMGQSHDVDSFKLVLQSIAQNQRGR